MTVEIRMLRWLLAMAAGAGLLLVGLLSPTDALAGKCNISGKERKLGASYVTSVKTKRVGCRKALKVVKKFHKCRKANGGANGRCKGKVKGFRCGEKRRGVPNVQYNSRVTCRKGAKRIRMTYTQNT